MRVPVSLFSSVQRYVVSFDGYASLKRDVPSVTSDRHPPPSSSSCPGHTASTVAVCVVPTVPGTETTVILALYDEAVSGPLELSDDAVIAPADSVPPNKADVALIAALDVMPAALSAPTLAPPLTVRPALDKMPADVRLPAVTVPR